MNIEKGDKRSILIFDKLSGKRAFKLACRMLLEPSG
jgi:hypothetical protein